MLRIENLVTGYGPADVVHGVSIRVPKGEVTGIVGANGAGKTALLQAVCGLLDHQGTIHLEGRDITAMRAYQRARSGIMLVPEGRRVFGDMSVADNLMTASLHHRVRRKRETILSSVFGLFPRLKERLGQPAGTLSGGEQQMLAIGRALMGDPLVLVLDEPSLGLSPLFVQEVFRALETLSKTGLTLILVEQNIQHCLRLSSYAYVLDQGRIVIEGKAASLLQDPRVREAYLGSHGKSAKTA
ncbi:ABC transporter ATP-binding protein [Bosea sp. (in: a-proteobacteria)]|uniref:ABC transporter ATP-binding protein n=1 Tax=Bosea sp. (in: a-proteobacteria) TaxID=1871050 RepID=UPI0026150DAB|nr:ABC transporter ATP-binding protein [Bosea sp. (in: a-proteobacteria)]MCO5091216.1 ABC transporter ATP-binding protein [Bosea sp. (in: a-proteobacteria)]